MAATRHVRTTDSRHNLPIAPNLIARDFTAAAPNRVWLAEHLHPDRGGMVVSNCRHGPLHPQDRWLGDAGLHAGRARLFCAIDGAPLAATRCRIDPSFRSRRAVRFTVRRHRRRLRRGAPRRRCQLLPELIHPTAQYRNRKTEIAKTEFLAH